MKLKWYQAINKNRQPKGIALRPVLTGKQYFFHPCSMRIAADLVS